MNHEKIRITKKYLNFPVTSKVERAEMTFTLDGRIERKFDIRLAASDPDYWVFCDVTALKGKTLTIKYSGNREVLLYHRLHICRANIYPLKSIWE